MKFNNSFDFSLLSIIFVALALICGPANSLEAQCAYGVWPTSKIYDASGGSGSVTVSPSSGLCPWTAASNTAWISVTAGSEGTGWGTFNYSVEANSSSNPRSGTVTVGGLTFMVTQTGVSSQFALDNWHLRTNGGGTFFFGTTYGNNRFAAGGQGTILTSQDGSAWQAVTLPQGVNDNFTGVAFGNNRFVAVGFMDKTVLASPDGLTWTAKDASSPVGLNNVVFCDGKFLVLGNSGTILTSPDGETWTTTVSSANHLYGAASGNGKIVVVGNFSVGGGIIVSADGGMTWTETTPKNADGQVTINALRGVAFGNGLFVAVGQFGTILTSSDGIVWTQRPVGIEERHLTGVIFSKGMFIAVGQNGTVIISPDGINWSYRTTGVTNELRGLTFGNRTFVAVGDSAVIQSDPLYSISGFVRDSSSQVGIAGVTASAKDVSNNVVETIATDASGHYVAAMLYPGQYTVEASKRGYTVASPPLFPMSLDDAHKAVTADAILMASSMIASLQLNQGWNFISTPRQPPSSQLIETALGDILGQVAIIWSYDNEKKTWLRYRAAQGGDGQNTLTTFHRGNGYWIYMNTAATMDLVQWPIPESSSIYLYEGWNLVGYEKTDGDSSNAVLASLSGKWSAIWNWTNNEWFGKHETIAILPAPFQALSAFYQGKAYWIKARRGMAGNWPQ
jgi:hypothetical protein